MKRFFGWGRGPGAAMSDNRGGPWGPGGGDDGGSGGGGGDGPRNPWGQPPRRRKPGRTGDVTSLDEFLKKSRDRIGRRCPPSDGRPYWLYGLIAFALLWILFTSVHRISPQERGVVTTFGYYERTMRPGIGFTWPAPIGRVQKVDVENIRTLTIPENQRDRESHPDRRPERHRPRLFGALEHQGSRSASCSRSPSPRQTIREVAESSMRAVRRRGCRSTTRSAPAAREIEQNVEQNMQQLLDAYGAGIRIQGVAINQSAPPAGGQRGLPPGLGGAAAGAELHERRPRLRAPDHRQGTGRRRRLREGLCRISHRARGDPPANVLRDDGAGPVSGSTPPSSRRPASRPICRCPKSSGARPQAQPQQGAQAR